MKKFLPIKLFFLAIFFVNLSLILESAANSFHHDIQFEELTPLTIENQRTTVVEAFSDHYVKIFKESQEYQEKYSNFKDNTIEFQEALNQYWEQPKGLNVFLNTVFEEQKDELHKGVAITYTLQDGHSTIQEPLNALGVRYQNELISYIAYYQYFPADQIKLITMQEMREEKKLPQKAIYICLAATKTLYQQKGIFNRFLAEIIYKQFPNDTYTIATRKKNTILQAYKRRFKDELPLAKIPHDLDEKKYQALAWYPSWDRTLELEEIKRQFSNN